METLFAILAGAAFLIFGLFHIQGAGAMEGYISATIPKAAPVARALNVLAIFWLFASGIGIAIRQPFGFIAAIVYLVAVSVLFHRPSGMEDQTNVTTLVKHLGWIGALGLGLVAL